jgi:hypothetical protein
MSEENIPSENSKKEILNSKQEEVTKNISQQKTIAQTETQTETQPETQNTNSKLKNMEVHHHPQVEKKGIKEYFFEFLMIFLAVTLGFIAENIRGHLSDKRIEREYIISFVEDLKQDTANFNRVIPLAESNLKGVDSLLNSLLDTPYTDSSLRLIYYMKERYADVIWPMSYTTRTITQLKNAGGLRLITDKRSSDSINVYNLALDDVEELFKELQRDFTIPTIRLSNKIYNPQFLIPYERAIYTSILSAPDSIIPHSEQKMKLLTKDQSVISEYINSLAWDRKLKYLYLNRMIAHRQLALRLITFFSKGYNLKDE